MLSMLDWSQCTIVADRTVPFVDYLRLPTGAMDYIP
jgi:hypothetical protein